MNPDPTVSPDLDRLVIEWAFRSRQKWDTFPYGKSDGKEGDQTGWHTFHGGADLLHACRSCVRDARELAARFAAECERLRSEIASLRERRDIDNEEAATIFAALVSATGVGPEWRARFLALAPKYELLEKRTRVPSSTPSTPGEKVNE